MSSERSGNHPGPPPPLSLEDLVAQKPRALREALEPGNRPNLGERIGTRRARSLEYDGSSPIAPGDEPRMIDWRATARTGTTQIKRFAAQTHRAHMIVADLRAALYFGTSRRLMAKTVALMAARIAWRAQLLHEPVGLAVPGGPFLHPARGRRHLLRLLDSLRICHNAIPAPASLPDTAGEAAETLRTGDELCVVSDFSIDTAELLDAMRNFEERLHMTAYLVEDPMFNGRLPTGCYPLQSISSGHGSTVFVSAANADTVAERAAAQRRTRIDLFGDRGWAVRDAADLLAEPEGSRP